LTKAYVGMGANLGPREVTLLRAVDLLGAVAGVRVLEVSGLRETAPVPVIPVRAILPAYAGPAIGWPPGWAGLWTRTHVMPAPQIRLTPQEEERNS
jgi:hypothetical protein